MSERNLSKISSNRKTKGFQCFHFSVKKARKGCQKEIVSRRKLVCRMQAIYFRHIRKRMLYRKDGFRQVFFQNDRIVYAHKNPILNDLLRHTETLTFIHSLYLADYQPFAKKLQKEAKKILKK